MPEITFFEKPVVEEVTGDGPWLYKISLLVDGKAELFSKDPDVALGYYFRGKLEELSVPGLKITLDEAFEVGTPPEQIINRINSQVADFKRVVGWVNDRIIRHNEITKRDGEKILCERFQILEDERDKERKRDETFELVKKHFQGQE